MFKPNDIVEVDISKVEGTKKYIQLVKTEIKKGRGQVRVLWQPEFNIAPISGILTNDIFDGYIGVDINALKFVKKGEIIKEIPQKINKKVKKELKTIKKNPDYIKCQDDLFE